MQAKIKEKNEIILPDVHVNYSTSLPPGELLLAGGGRAPAADWLCQASQRQAALVH